MKKRRNLYAVIALMILFPFLALLVRELARGQTIWYFRLTDLVDLIVVAPLYLLILLWLNEYMIRHQSPVSVRIMFGMFSALLLYGHAMHLTANAINTFSTEVRNYQAILPTDTYDLIYFLDETLSHILLFIAFYGLLVNWVIFEFLATAPPLLSAPSWIVAMLGFIYGVVQTFAIVEAGKVWFVLFLQILLLFLLLWIWRKSNLTLMQYIRDRPVTLFVITFSQSLLVTLIAFYLIFGSFSQPSQLGI